MLFVLMKPLIKNLDGGFLYGKKKRGVGSDWMRIRNTGLMRGVGGGKVSWVEIKIFVCEPGEPPGQGG